MAEDDEVAAFHELTVLDVALRERAFCATAIGLYRYDLMACFADDVAENDGCPGVQLYHAQETCAIDHDVQAVYDGFHCAAHSCGACQRMPFSERVWLYDAQAFYDQRTACTSSCSSYRHLYDLYG